MESSKPNEKSIGLVNSYMIGLLTGAVILIILLTIADLRPAYTLSIAYTSGIFIGYFIFGKSGFGPAIAWAAGIISGLVIGFILCPSASCGWIFAEPVDELRLSRVKLFFWLFSGGFVLGKLANKLRGYFDLFKV